MREKFLPRRLAFLIIVRGRGQREILKNPRPTGSWQPVKSIFGKRKKDRPQRAGSPALSVLCTGKPERGKSAAVTEQVSTTVPESAILRFCPSRETCWGVPSPNPAMAACAAKIFPQQLPSFWENLSVVK